MKFADSGKEVSGANVNGNLAQTEQKNATVAAQAQPKNATVAVQAQPKNATAAVNIVQKKAHAHHKKHHTSLAQHSHKTGVKKHGGKKVEAKFPNNHKVHESNEE